jgi:protocatechuate 3,4-dioxygenase beta subunit
VVGLVAVVAAASVLVVKFRDSTKKPLNDDGIPRAKVVRSAPATFEPTLTDHPPRALRLEGQAVDDKEQPIGDARVVLLTDVRQEVATAADGTFAFDNLEEGSYQLVAIKDDASSAAESVTLTTSSDPVILRLVHGSTLRVHVLGADDNKPIAGASVSDGLGHKEKTSSEGVVELRGIVDKAVQLWARAEGRGAVSLFVEVERGAVTQAVTIKLPRGSTLSGTVIGPDGKLVAKAHVYATPRGRPGFFPDRDVFADTAGAWKIQNLEAGQYELRADSDLYTQAPPFSVELDGVHERTNVIVHVETGAQLVGTAIDESGKPQTGATVSITSEEKRWWSSEKTDDKGRFAFIGIPPGGYVVEASGGNKASTRQRVEAPDKTRVEIVLKLADSSIAGMVVGDEGEPVEGAELVIQWEQQNWFKRATSDAKGAFDFGGVPPGDYELHARRREKTDGESFRGLDVKSGDRNLKVIVPGVTTLIGRVLLDNKPVSYFGLSVTGRNELEWRQSFPVVIRSADGRFKQEGVSTGERMVAIAGPGFARKLLPVKITDGNTFDVGDVSVDHGQRITGHVTDGSGAPIEGAEVVVEQDAPVHIRGASPMVDALQGGGTARTDAAGAYAIEGIAPPPEERLKGWSIKDGNQISASHPAKGTTPSRDLAPSASTVDFVLGDTGRIDGTIEGALGSLDHVTAQLEGSKDVQLAILQGPRFSFENLTPGKYTLTLARQNSDGFHVPPINVTVTAKQRAGAMFKLPAAVTVAAHLPKGKCSFVVVVPADGKVDMEPHRALGFARCTDSDAIIEGVPAGRYRLCTAADRCVAIAVQASPARQVFELAPAVE